MELKQPLPPNRSFEQVKNHYEVEMSIAKRLKESSREERQLILATMYDELLRKVPDHPRLSQKDSQDTSSSNINRSKFSLVSCFLRKSYVFAEFGPGDCKFAFEVANYVKNVYGFDISDQRNLTEEFPENFRLVVFDGYNLDNIEDNLFDIIFSDQVIEHLHPDDVKFHFQLAHRILKKGGRYVFRTPHALTGPHDVSKYFSDEPECFHLKEWTYHEMKRMLTDLNYTSFSTYWHAKKINVHMPYIYFALCEHILGMFPKKHVRPVAKYLIPVLYGVAIK